MLSVKEVERRIQSSMAMGVRDFSLCLSSYFLGPSAPPSPVCSCCNSSMGWCTFSMWYSSCSPSFSFIHVLQNLPVTLHWQSLYSSRLFFFCSPNILKPDLGTSTSQIFFYCPTNLAVAMSSDLVIPLACSRWQLSVLTSLLLGILLKLPDWGLWSSCEWTWVNGQGIGSHRRWTTLSKIKSKQNKAFFTNFPF